MTLTNLSARLLAANSESVPVPHEVLATWLVSTPGPDLAGATIAGWDPTPTEAATIAAKGWQHAALVARHTTNPDVLERLSRHSSVGVRRTVGLSDATSDETRERVFRWMHHRGATGWVTIGTRLPYPVRLEFASNVSTLPNTTVSSLLSSPGQVSLGLVCETVTRFTEEQTPRNQVIAVRTIEAFVSQCPTDPSRILGCLEAVYSILATGTNRTVTSMPWPRFVGGSGSTQGPVATFEDKLVRATWEKCRRIDANTTHLHKLVSESSPQAYGQLLDEWRYFKRTEWKIDEFGSAAEVDEFCASAPAVGILLAFQKAFPPERFDRFIADPLRDQDELERFVSVHAQDMTLDQMAAVWSAPGGEGISILHYRPDAPFDLLVRTVSLSGTDPDDVASWLFRGNSADDVAVLVETWLTDQHTVPPSEWAVHRLLERIIQRSVWHDVQLPDRAFEGLLRGLGPLWSEALDSLGSAQVASFFGRDQYELVNDLLLRTFGDDVVAWTQAVAMLEANRSTSLEAVVEAVSKFTATAQAG